MLTPEEAQRFVNEFEQLVKRFGIDDAQFWTQKLSDGRFLYRFEFTAPGTSTMDEAVDRVVRRALGNRPVTLEELHRKLCELQRDVQDHLDNQK